MPGRRASALSADGPGPGQHWRPSDHGTQARSPSQAARARSEPAEPEGPSAWTMYLSVRDSFMCFVTVAVTDAASQ